MTTETVQNPMCIFCWGNLYPGQERGHLRLPDGSQGHYHAQCLVDAKRTLHPIYVRWQQMLRAEEEDEL